MIYSTHVQAHTHLGETTTASRRALAGLRCVIGCVLHAPCVTVGRGVMLNVHYIIDLTSELMSGTFSVVYRLKMAPSPHVCSAVLQNFYEWNEIR